MIALCRRAVLYDISARRRSSECPSSCVPLCTLPYRGLNQSQAALHRCPPRRRRGHGQSCSVRAVTVRSFNIANDDDEDQVIFCIIELCNLFSQSENETNRLSVLWGTNGRVTRLATYLSIGQQQFCTIILISCVPGIVISRTCQFVCLCAMELHPSTGVE